MILHNILFYSWNFTVANMELSVIEGVEQGSEFNCGVSSLFKRLRFKVDTLRGVLYAFDRSVVMQPASSYEAQTLTHHGALYLIQGW